MARFTGTMFKGAKSVAKDLRREEAEARNAATPDHRRREYREPKIYRRAQSIRRPAAATASMTSSRPASSATVTPSWSA